MADGGSNVYLDTTAFHPHFERIGDSGIISMLAMRSSVSRHRKVLTLIIS
ncbi:MAG: hypothetical protein ACKO23_09810 [Gemmataceae bacterium]